ncbi:MAG: daunorubicin resistance protein DrrA family ABC transporter ATP-binding protein [Anaerolineae bacterium]|nr:MAG: daunorubicin resistance protein DrrA family ABC transporter ATP-binding protein [Anaerolineae bacterium]
MEPEIRIEELSKTYYPKQRKGLFKSETTEVEALKSVSLQIHEGEIFGLLGPNGAGKTTLIKCLTTLLLPSSGDAWIHGRHIVEQENEVRAAVGCMLMGERGLYWKLTARENLEFFGALYHLSSSDRKLRSDEIIELLHMEEIADRTVETYSSGQKMMLAFGKSLINDAPVLILDEPTNTLDVPAARELRGLVRELNEEGKTIVYTTHIMSEAETLCDRVAIIDHGEVIDLGTVPDLKSSLHRDHVTHIEGVIPEAARAAVGSLPEVTKVAIAVANGTTKLTVVSSDGRVVLPRLIEALTENGALVQQIEPEHVTLEDVFVAKTGRTLSEDTRVV